MFGFLNVRKPAGPTSHDVVARVRRMLPRRTKVGHTGTLDPFADGVLVLAVGAASRLADLIQARPKRYRATVTLGERSTTDDPEGDVIPTPDADLPDAHAVQQALGAFRGEIEQVPPAHSAVHVEGRRAYDLARAGQRPEIPPRRVVIHHLALVDYQPPRAVLEVLCGRGTYLRSLARDLGDALGVGGWCSALTRSAVGEFDIDRAVDLEHLRPTEHLVDALDGVGFLPRAELTDEQEREVRLGRALAVGDAQRGRLSEEIESNGDERRVALSRGTRLVALADLDGSLLRPRKVFPPTTAAEPPPPRGR
jgi:tRNA pseudouridine55 synthase